MKRSIQRKITSMLIVAIVSAVLLPMGHWAFHKYDTIIGFILMAVSIILPTIATIGYIVSQNVRQPMNVDSPEQHNSVELPYNGDDVADAFKALLKEVKVERATGMIQMDATLDEKIRDIVRDYLHM